jgi:RES domain-containing protein
MLIYRITKSKRAGDLSGMGASLHPGRWNKKGTFVLYCGESKEIALLENIVHIPPMLSPDLDLITIEIPNNSITVLTPSQLPSNWYHFPAPIVLSELGQRWIDENKTIALKVPSSIIHSANNILLNCQHHDFDKVKIINRQKFHFDSRLRK